MEFIAKARYIKYSPYKLRPLADVVRGKDAGYAISWLTTYRTKRSIPVKKAIQSAAANAKQQSVELSGLVVKDIRIDHGPMYRYFKPSAMGRAMPQRRRTCHISVVLSAKSKQGL